MIELHSERRSLIAKRLLQSPVAKRLRIGLIDAKPGLISLSMPHSPENATEGATVHGGVICTLADITAVACAVSSANELPVGAATANLSISFLAKAEGKALSATGQTVRVGFRQTVVRVTLSDASGGAVAEALVTVLLFSGKPIED
jgi:uncharacterized protein (TIGR00369 family)